MQCLAVPTNGKAIVDYEYLSSTQIRLLHNRQPCSTRGGFTRLNPPATSRNKVPNIPCSPSDQISTQCPISELELFRTPHVTPGLMKTTVKTPCSQADEKARWFSFYVWHQDHFDFQALWRIFGQVVFGRMGDSLIFLTTYVRRSWTREYVDTF